MFSCRKCDWVRARKPRNIIHFQLVQRFPFISNLLNYYVSFFAHLCVYPRLKKKRNCLQAHNVATTMSNVFVFKNVVHLQIKKSVFSFVCQIVVRIGWLFCFILFFCFACWRVFGKMQHQTRASEPTNEFFLSFHTFFLN